LYFWRDIAALVIVWFRGIGNSELRSDPE
jgi:hypothetical protein